MRKKMKTALTSREVGLQCGTRVVHENDGKKGNAAFFGVIDFT
jgi:hypothetical protein